MPRRTRDEDIPIKIGGWNGKFVYEKPTVIQEPAQNAHGESESTAKGHPREAGDKKPVYATGNQFYGYTTEPEVLPVTWDGTFAPSGGTYYRPERNRSETSQFYGFCSEPEILPVQWSGKFEVDPNDVRIKPERNSSDVRDYADHRNFVERKPTQEQDNGQETH
ncbi:uncharacterized protein LOC132259934 [Phlebotomus argentipes]|uniref:uncharacterized protein LOC132259934 n=1 Tax=Phlebotomus argentipes TaxID=94469 RepID=UPI00289379B3|nr:uncharacterized protein LOC132259934 [Phlebotomus argentipes]